MYHVDPAKVNRIIVNESEGKKPEQYVVKDVTFNFKDMVATKALQTSGNVTGGGSGYLTGGVRGMTGTGSNTGQLGSRFTVEQGEIAVNAEHVFVLV